MNTTIPECLTRTATDDRAEAESVAFATDRDADWRGTAYKRACDEALAAIQRREAWTLDIQICHGFEATSEVKRIAKAAAAEAHLWCIQNRWTLAQRATLLDCARNLARTAFEVAS